MKLLFRLALASVAAFVVAFAVMYLVGMAQPERHVASRYADFHQPPDSVWAAITDWERSPAWRKGVSSVERLPDRDGRPAWKEVSEGSPMVFVVTEEIPPLRLVTTLADSNAGFGGSWTYSLAPGGPGTRLTVVERGFVQNPLFRFLMRFVFGTDSTLDAYLTGLGSHFGETVAPADAGVKE